MIVSFAHRGLKRFFETGDLKGIDKGHAGKLRRQLDKLDAATDVTDMNVPGWRLHRLKGDRKATWAVDVSGQWRMTFEFRDGNAYVVDYEQYH
jgi:proteic killer suppression protein